MSETGNPLLDAFQQLQPDVDVVVLPPEPPLDLLEVSDPAEAERAAHSTRTTALSLVEEVRGTGEPVVIERWDRLAPGVHRHRTRVRVTFTDDASALASILDVLDSLAGAGWDPRPVDAPTPWLVARSPLASSPLLTADVAVQGPRLVVTVESAALRLEQDPA